jgi:predicted HTH transcriptional regulator
MKVIEMESGYPTLAEVISLAERPTVILRQPTGKTFVLATIDDFDVEVNLWKNNQEFMSFLKELSQEPATISLGQLREPLGLS